MSSIHFGTSSLPHPHILAEDLDDVSSFFRSNPIEPTPLVRLPGLSEDLGVHSISVKDESKRLGMNAFKVVGVHYAVSRLESAGRLGAALACATDGNHGRAVARAAANRGLSCHVFVPAQMVPARQQAIRDAGAHVHPIEGTYDVAVSECAREAAVQGWTIISDTAWAGYEEIPRWIMAGYSWIAEEASRQWFRDPDFVFLQAGVGGFACGIISWFLQKRASQLPSFIVTEPAKANCVQAAARIGHPIQLRGDLDTVMAGLSCGKASPAAWPVLAGNVSAFLALSDRWAEESMRALARSKEAGAPVVAGESGAAGLAGLLALRRDAGLKGAALELGLDKNSHVLVFNTEGDTDPENYRRVVG